jgi:hypothetical protein
MHSSLLRASLTLLLITSSAQGSDAFGIVSRVVGEWRVAGTGQLVSAGMHVSRDDSFSAEGADPHELNVIRYDEGTMERSVCPSQTSCKRQFRLAASARPALTANDSIAGRLVEYLKGGAKLPPVYAESRSFSVTAPDPELMRETLIVPATPGAVDFSGVLKKGPAEGFALLVQNTQESRLAKIDPNKTMRAQFDGAGRGVYILRMLDKNDGIVATSLVLAARPESIGRARQSLSDAYAALNQWDKQAAISPEARLTILLNALIGIGARL